MPRYNNVDTITFTDINGVQYPIKDIREISTQTLDFEIDIKEGDLLDEVASRQETFGNFGEVHAWRIFDLNAEEIAQVDYDLNKLKKLKIPLL